MRKLLLLCLFPIAAQAAIRADVHPDTTHCGVIVDALPKVIVPAQNATIGPAAPTGRICEYDPSSLGQGTHTIRMTAIVATTPTVIGGESAPSMPPFDFQKRDTPSVPSNIRIQ